MVRNDKTLHGIMSTRLGELGGKCPYMPFLGRGQMSKGVWGNSKISVNANFIINEWFNKGIRNIMDLIDENGLFYNFQNLQERYDIYGTREQPRGRLGRLSRFFRRHFAPGRPAGEVSVAGFRSR